MQQCSLEDEIRYAVFPYETTSNIEEEKTIVAIGTKQESMQCECHYFEFVGVPCCHMLAYLNFKRSTRMPDFLIKDRWTKGFKDGIKIRIYDEEHLDSKWEEYMELTRRANELINLAIGDRNRKEIFIRHMKEAKEEFDINVDTPAVISSVEGRSAKRCITMFQKNSSKSEINVKNPPLAKTKGSGRGGRPKLGVAKRLRSDFELITKKPRTCKKCGLSNAGHDSRNCPSIQSEENSEPENNNTVYFSDLSD